jgi:hypothetical protein
MPTRRTASLKSLLALRASVGVEMVTEKIKHLRRSASPRTPRLRLQLARVHWRPVPSAHRLPSRPGLKKELVISHSCDVLSGTALCPEGLLEAVLCGYAFRYCTLSGRLRAQRVPVGEGRAAGRLWSPWPKPPASIYPDRVSGSMYGCVVCHVPFCDVLFAFNAF